MSDQVPKVTQLWKVPESTKATIKNKEIFFINLVYRFHLKKDSLRDRDEILGIDVLSDVKMWKVHYNSSITTEEDLI